MLYFALVYVEKKKEEKETIYIKIRQATK